MRGPDSKRVRTDATESVGVPAASGPDWLKTSSEDTAFDSSLEGDGVALGCGLGDDCVGDGVRGAPGWLVRGLKGWL